MAESRGIEDLVAAVLDRAPIDWTDLENNGPRAARELLPYLKIVAEVVRAHSEAEQTPPTGSQSSISVAANPGPAPRSWGGLTLIERVARGSFGEVYRAWDPRLARDVALKLLRRGESARSPRESVAIEEGRLLARVRHPNVVTVHGADRIDGRVGVWMEFLRGPTLSDLVRSNGPLPAEEAMRIGIDLCAALSAVHDAGLLHRDVKARNVIREDGGRIVLMDFGAGHQEDDEGSAARRAGTPLYLAPEVVNGEPATAQSDLYSVGVLLYHLVTGGYPVTGRSADELYEAHARGLRTPLREARPDLPGRFVEVVERALAADRSERHRSAAELGSALAALQEVRKPALRRSRTFIGLPRTAILAIALTAVGTFLVPSALRNRLLGGSSGAPPASTGAVTIAATSQLSLRKVSLPSGLLVGRPSADGQFFSYSDDDGRLALFEISTGKSRPLTTQEAGSPEHAMESAISADSRFVAYTWAALDGRYELRVISTEGKEPRVVFRRDDVDGPRPLEWSRDGRWILSDLARTDGTHQLALVAADGGEMRPIRDLGPAVPQNASLSPDGELIVYDAPQAGSGAARDVFIVGAEGGDPRVLQSHPGNDVAPVWTPDGRQVLFASDRSGAMDLWRVAVAAGDAAGDPELVHRNVGRMWLLGVTDQGRYYIQLLVGVVEAYSATLSPEGRVGRPIPLGPSFAGSNISSIWSPDGRYVAYASRRGLVGFDRGSTTLVIRDLRTDERREFVPPLKGFLVRAWSPDGRRIIVHGSESATRTGLFAVDAETGRTTPFLVPGGMGRVQWAPAGARILYGAPSQGALLFRDLASGREDVALDFRDEAMEGLGAWSNGRGFKLSPDGRTLAFGASFRERETRTTALRVKTDGQPSRELLRVTAPERLVFQDWMPDGDALLFTRATESEAPSLWRIAVQGVEAEPLAFAMTGLRDVSVHPDGRQITFTAGWPSLEVWVIENVLLEGRSSGNVSPGPPQER